MAYDADLAERIRAALGDERDVTEKRMFGGLAFLVGGRMAVAASRSGGLMARVLPDEIDALTRRTGVVPMQMRGRAVRGWVVVEPARVRTARQLAEWVERGTACARSAG